MGEIIIEETNYKAFALTMAHLFLLIASVAIVVYGFHEHKARYWLPGILISMIFLIGFAGALIKALSVKRLLTITVEGVIDNSSVGPVGFISFDEIKEFQIVTILNKKAIAVIPKNIDNFLSKLPVVKRGMVKRNLNLNMPPVTINVDMAKDMEPEDILSLLQKRLDDYRRLYDY